MDSDPSPHVRIVAAEAVAGLGNPATAVTFLASTLDHGANIPLKLQAINALTFTGAAAAVRDSVVRATQADDIGLRSAARYLLARIDGTYRPDFPVLDREHFLRSVPSA